MKRLSFLQLRGTSKLLAQSGIHINWCRVCTVENTKVSAHHWGSVWQQIRFVDIFTQITFKQEIV